MTPHASTAEVLRTTDELTFQWLRLKKIVYRDAHDKERTWELAQRTTRRGSVDGVGIIARLRKRGQVDQIVLCSQVCHH
jgi:hypothetical protein